MSKNYQVRGVWTSQLAADFSAYHGDKRPNYPVEEESPMRQARFHIGDIIRDPFCGSHCLIEGFHYHVRHKLWMYDMRYLETNETRKDFIETVDNVSLFKKVA